MGVFSDKDINDADKLIQRELERTLRSASPLFKDTMRIEFLTYFEEGLKRCKANNIYVDLVRPRFRNGEGLAPLTTGPIIKDSSTKIPITNDNVTYYLDKVIDSSGLIAFAEWLGILVGIMRYHPQDVLGILTREFMWFERYVGALKDKPAYYKFLRVRIINWAKKIKTKYWKVLERFQRQTFLEFIKEI